MAWEDVSDVYQFPVAVPDGTYAATVIQVLEDEYQHLGVPATAIVFRIIGGPQNNKLVFDWFPLDSRGLERVKAISGAIGYTLQDGQSHYDIMQLLDGKTFDVTVRAFDTPVHFQRCSRVEFLGYALP